MNKLTTAIYRFFQYIRWCFKGGYTQILLSQVNYPNIMEGKRVLITGGSEGIGFAMAKKFISVGAHVVITGRNKEKLKCAEVELASTKLHSLQWDVSDTDSIVSKLDEVRKLMGGIDIVINNAAFLSHYDGSESYFDKTLSTNIKGVYYMCKYCAEMMRNENGVDGGKIINISSINSYQASTHPYYISKRAVNSITEGFAKQYAPYNIIVNAIAPGYCDSNINKQNAGKNAYYPSTANGRITIPSEIAEIAVFLCSGAANGIIGQTIVCDGGSLL